MVRHIYSVVTSLYLAECKETNFFFRFYFPPFPFSLPPLFLLILLNIVEPFRKVNYCRSLNKAVKSKNDQIHRLEDELKRDKERKEELEKKIEV